MEENKSTKKKSSKGLKAALIALIVVAVCVLGFSAYKLIGINNSYNEAEELYQEIENMFEVEERASTSDASPSMVNDSSYRAVSLLTAETNEETDAAVQEPIAETAAEEAGSDEKEDAVKEEESAQTTELKNTVGNVKFASLKWDYNKLYNYCEDSVGYIYQDGIMAYPIVQAADNNKYLRHMINGEYNVAGTIFVDAICDQGLEGRYSIMYGHNMDDKSMFGSLTSYKDEEYYKEHPSFELYVGDDMYVYYVYAAFKIEQTGFIYNFNLNEDDEAFFETMKQIKELQDEQYPMKQIKITKNSVVTVLSTCIDYPRDYTYRYCVVLVRGEKLVEEKLEDTGLVNEEIGSETADLSEVNGPDTAEKEQQD